MRFTLRPALALVPSLVIGLGTTLLAPAALAGSVGPAPITTINSQSRDDNSVFVGVNWNFGAREGLTGVLGYRIARVDEDNDVRGAVIDITVPLTGADLQLGELHLKYLMGSDTLQGEAGFGYSFQGESLLLNGGLRGPYSTVGVDYLLEKGWMPYLGVTSLDATDEHDETRTLSCPSGFELSGSICVNNNLD